MDCQSESCPVSTDSNRNILKEDTNNGKQTTYGPTPITLNDPIPIDQNADHASSETNIAINDVSNDTTINTMIVPAINNTTKHIPIPITSETPLELWRRLFIDILKIYTCYHLMPVSAKVIAFDSGLPVKYAFRALAENDIKCAPVWCSKKNEFIGFMTTTDFADILYSYKKEDEVNYENKVSRLERDTVGHWCMFRKKHRSSKISKKFVYSRGSDPIFVAVHKMRLHFIHRMPIKHKNSLLCILNHAQILRFVFQKLIESHARIYVRVRELSYAYFDDNRQSLKGNSSVSSAVSLFSQNKQLFAIPIIDENNVVFDALLRSDLKLFARNQAYMHLDLTVSQFILKYRPNQIIPQCRVDDNLLAVLWNNMLCRRIHVCMVFDPEISVSVMDADGGLQSLTSKFLGFLNISMIFNVIIDENELKDMYSAFKHETNKNRHQRNTNVRQQSSERECNIHAN